MYEQSFHAIISARYLPASLSACHGLLIITVITPLPTKPSATKMPEIRSTERGNYWHADASAWCCCARIQKYTKELADAKAENDALRDDVAAIVVGCTSKQSVSQCAATRRLSGVDNAASPTGRHRWTGLFHPQRELTTRKTIRHEPVVINEQCR